MSHFLVCIHDATPAYARETRAMIQDLAPLVGRRLSLGVVPDWHGEWPLAAHSDYCEFVQESAEELLLHGYVHKRQRGWGPTSLLAEGSDEMNGLDSEETRRAIESGQRAFTRAFGKPARGFLPPAWQRGHMRGEDVNALGIEYVFGYFSLASCGGRNVSLATWTWDCGRWAWLGHIGHGLGTIRGILTRGIPVMAVHPRDIARGYWPTILGLAEKLLDAGYEPATPTRLLGTSDVEVAV